MTCPAPAALTPPAPQAGGAAAPVPAGPVPDAGEGPARPAAPPGVRPVVTVCAHPRSFVGPAAGARPSCPPDAEESAIRNPHLSRTAREGVAATTTRRGQSPIPPLTGPPESPKLMSRCQARPFAENLSIAEAITTLLS